MFDSNDGFTKKFGSDSYQHKNNRSPSIVPLEVRLMEHNENDQNIDLLQDNLPVQRKSKQRVHNYCAML